MSALGRCKSLMLSLLVSMTQSGVVCGLALTRATISALWGARGCDLRVCASGLMDLRTNRVRRLRWWCTCVRVKTASGATAVQIVYSSRRGSRDIEHLGSAHAAEELEALKAVARQRIAEGQAEPYLGLSVAEAASSGGPLEIVSSRMGHLWGP